ncbi:ATP-binding Cassette (ABC) superfamily [Achlya hypogyna]|uniref:ATP-binding Cassette (ABC) superfamily n=1 Tax=Achlya hypogyna TaxID=1202772 RepID=A0A1V9ZCW6_ACHHY|nr:ATP-binding Cassette (ABC) superfamily [Achlya hypogyna]
MSKHLGLAALAVVAGSGALIWHYASPSFVADSVEWLRAHQLMGGVLYTVGFTASIVLCLPATLFELIAGYVFGFWGGWAISIVAKTAGSCLAFCLGRYLLHARVLRLLDSGAPLFRALGLLLARSDMKWKIVCLARAAWMPIAIKNYGLSVLPVPFSLFFWSTLLLGTPFGGISCYLGHSATQVSSLLSGHHDSGYLKFGLLAVGAASGLALLCLVGYQTRKYIEELADAERDDRMERASIQGRRKHDYIPISSFDDSHQNP